MSDPNFDKDSIRLQDAPDMRIIIQCESSGVPYCHSIAYYYRDEAAKVIVLVPENEVLILESGVLVTTDEYLDDIGGG